MLIIAPQGLEIGPAGWEHPLGARNRTKLQWKYDETLYFFPWSVYFFSDNDIAVTFGDLTDLYPSSKLIIQVK